MLAKMLSKEWLWIALGTAALLLFAVGSAAAQSNVPAQFAVQTTSASEQSPVRTAIYSADDQARVKAQQVWWRGWGWGRPYRAYYGGPYYTYYSAPYYTYYSAPYTTYYANPYTTYYAPAPYVSYYSAPYGYYYYPRRFYGPRYYYYRW